MKMNKVFHWLDERAFGLTCVLYLVICVPSLIFDPTLITPVFTFTVMVVVALIMLGIRYINRKFINSWRKYK